jgi:tetratricopeptide (TPR) repeat protein
MRQTQDPRDSIVCAGIAREMKESIDQALFQAKQYERAGDGDSALKIYKDLLSKHRKNKKLQARLLGLMESVRQTNEKTESSWRSRHQQLFEMYLAGEFSALVDELDQLTFSHPEAYELWNMLGMALEGKQKLFDAQKAFRKAAALCPNNADVLLNLALNSNKIGDTDSLKNILHALIKADSKKRSTFHDAGVLLYQLNALQAAEVAFNRALELDPHYAEAYNNLGIIMSAQGRLAAAIDNFELALKAAPDAPEAYNNLGNALRRSRRLSDSLPYFEQALTLRPDYGDALFNFGLALHDMGKIDVAVEQFKKALDIDPRSSKVLDSLATALQNLGNFSESTQHYEEALAQDPDFYQAHNNLGALLQKTGDINGAISHFNRAIQLSPTYTDALNNLGTALLELGDIEQATAAFSTAIKHDPRHVDAIRNLAGMRGSHISEDLFASINSMYEEAGLTIAEKAKLGYALFCLHKKRQEYDEAFQLLKAANQARRQDMNYDFQHDADLYGQLLQRPISHSNPTGNSFMSAPGIPIFICGMPRSGTTLIEQILSCHSEISAGGELRHIGVIRRTTKNLSLSDEACLRNLRSRYFGACHESLYETLYFTDKMPHNFLYIPEIIHAFPEAKIVHVFRAPEATCWSNFETFFRVNGMGYSYDLDDLVRYQNLYVRLMQRYADIYQGRICHIDYDALTLHQEPAIRNLFATLGIPFEQSALQPHLNTRHVATASNEQIREPIYTGSSDQWRKFEHHTADYFANLERFTPPR